MKLKLPKHINPKNKTEIYIDAANMFYSQKTMRFKIDYQKLYAFLDKAFNVRSVIYYTGYDPENVNQLKFLSKLEEFGYKVVRKPIKHINSGHKRIDKANVDVELAIDAVIDCELYTNFILASGDSDFRYLLEVLKEKGKNILVLSSRGHISRELRQLSDSYIPMEKLKKDIGVTT